MTWGATGGHRGSAVLLVLFVGLASALVLQAAWASILCVQSAVADERAGRQRLEVKEQALALLRDYALADGGGMPWTTLGGAEGNLEALPDGCADLLRARVRLPTSAGGQTVAMVERARDGLDLPAAAIVAGSVTASPGRQTAWVEVETDGGAPTGVDRARCHVVQPMSDAVLGPGSEVVPLRDAWSLGEGWTGGLVEQGIVTSGVSLQPAVVFVRGAPGMRRCVPDSLRSGAMEAALFLVTGGATLDARDLGEFRGVLVADGGSVLLDGTTVRGAVFASGEVCLGESGQVRFAPAVLRWATDRSLVRTRVVPGTRWEEGMD